MLHLVTHTKNNIAVYIDLIKSGAAKGISLQPHLLTLAEEVLRATALTRPLERLDYDMKRSIGYDFVVNTTAADTVFYGRCAKEDFYTRFIKNGKPLLTNYLSVELLRSPENYYIVQDLWIGRQMPAQPGKIEETAESREYWQDHAFVFENQRLQTHTLTKTCPY